MEHVNYLKKNKKGENILELVYKKIEEKDKEQLFKLINIVLKVEL